MSEINKLVTVLSDIVKSANPRLAYDLGGNFRLSLEHYIALIPANIASEVNEFINIALSCIKYLDHNKILHDMKPVKISSKEWVLSHIAKTNALNPFDPVFKAIDYIMANPTETIGRWLMAQQEEVDF